MIIVLMSAVSCHAAEVVFVRSAGGSAIQQTQMETATTFYGVDLKVIEASDALALNKSIEREETVGVAIAADVLTSGDGSKLLGVLNQRLRPSVPVLILGVTPELDATVLRSWSAGAVSGCQALVGPHDPQYVFGRVDGLTAQLSDLEMASAPMDVSYLVSDQGATQRIMSVRDDARVFPVFVEVQAQKLKVFVACAMKPDGHPRDAEYVVKVFLQNAPAMMFVKYCAGQQGWHSLHHYANLTVDDPWLRQPYGYVDYEGLLDEMENHNFHTTIAFIPWNYGRSQPGVVALFKDHPERFSIAIHGNNHDHKEFTDYQSKPLVLQTAALQQSLARMERFHALTGISYDKVMVFPHSIAPQETLAALQTSNYLATVNEQNVPDGEAEPAAAAFFLRPVTLQYAGFPSIRRHSMAVPVTKAYVAVSAYLENPMFYYGHSDDFAKGVQAFDDVADKVNKLQPDTRWRGLTEIVEHLYLVRSRSVSDYDVLALSNNVCLENSFQRDAIFHVRKQGAGSQAVRSVVANGREQPYSVQDGYLNFSIAVPKDGTQCVAIKYGSDPDLSSVNAEHDSLTVYILRMASDFRDIELSKSDFGLAFIHYYNEHSTSAAVLLGFVLVFMGLSLYGSFHLRVFRKAQRQGSSERGLS